MMTAVPWLSKSEIITSLELGFRPIQLGRDNEASTYGVDRITFLFEIIRSDETKGVFERLPTTPPSRLHSE